MTLADWMRFAQDQLDGVHGRGRLVSAKTYRILHTPVSENYALGWGVKLDGQGMPLLLTHSGSNGHWLADIRIMPKHNMIILFVSNAGNDAANPVSYTHLDVYKRQVSSVSPVESETRCR